MSAAVGAGKLLDNWWEGEQKPDYAISPLCRGRTPAFSGRFSLWGEDSSAGELLLLLDNEPALIHLRGLAGEMAHLAMCLPHKQENLNLDA